MTDATIALTITEPTDALPRATMSPSSAHRWMRCPASATFGALFQQAESDHAAEGTLAHKRASEELAAFLLNDEGPVTPVEAEWMPYIQQYVEYCARLASDAVSAAVEQPVTIGHLTGEMIDGAPARGTADFIAISEGGTLHIADLKFGTGVLVHAANGGEPNAQLGMYALGALYELGSIFDIREVQLHVVQPRRDHVSTATFSLEQMQAFGEKVRAAARRVVENPAQFNPSPGACRWCPGRSHCAARANLARSMVAQDFATVATADLPPLLEQLDNIRRWCDDIEARAMRELREGKDLGGWKLVEGRGTTKWAPEAEQRLPELLGDDAWRIERRLITVTEAARRLGKKELQGITVRVPGAPKLAPASDPRPPLRLDAASDFTIEQPNEEE
jgi:hypothetical protein